MKNCPYCNTPLEDSAKYCNICGKKLEKANKLPLILAIISSLLVGLGFSIVINIISIVIAIATIVISIIKKDSSYKMWSLGLSIFSIIGSILLIIYNFL